MSIYKIYFKKVRDVKTPKRANPTDAGIDFYVPFLDDKMAMDIIDKNPHNIGAIRQVPGELGENEEHYVLRLDPGKRILIPSGIHVTFLEKESALISLNKSGLAANRGIIVTSQVVDSDYTGEMHIGIYNCSNSTVSFGSGDKVGQFVHVPIFLSDMEEVDEETYDNLTNGSSRGANGFGSTDKQ